MHLFECDEVYFSDFPSDVIRTTERLASWADVLKTMKLDPFWGSNFENKNKTWQKGSL